MSPALPPLSKSVAFTLLELMIAVSVFAVGAAIVYPLFVADFSLYARNFSINKSNNSLRHSLQRLKNSIDAAVESPLLMSYRVSGSTGYLKPADATNATTGVVTTAAVSAPAIMMWVNLGPAYDLVPSVPVTGTATGTITPASGVTLNRASAFPTVQVGDRLVILNPGPYDTGMPDVVKMDGATLQKPGRRINAITSASSTSLTVQLDLTPAQGGTALPANISAKQTAYIVRETAYVAYNVADASGSIVERQLLYYPTTNDMTKAQILVHDLDPTPQEIDPTTKVVIAPFNYYSGRSYSGALSVVLPIRAVDYARGLNDRNVGSGTNTSSTEFDVYLRSNPQMGIKALLDH